ncbi:Phosphatidate cytidylyltransferase [hydrothermal vent metagenome]|uniref:Phosphatidate cytidylyltransferase n=1 Tax=hydrothermal vent metagenome TaxID=652676 RepID=A0A3B0ZHM8_9ZZZZ
MLKQRLMTAVILIPLFVWAILSLPNAYFAILFALIATIGATEWCRLADIPAGFASGSFSAVTIILFGLMWVVSADLLLFFLGAAVVWWFVVLGMVLNYPKGNLLKNRTFKVLAGLLLLVPCWLALVTLHNRSDDGPLYVLFLLTLIWVADSAAYFSGRQWGNKKMAPNVSPGKTMAGLWGAVVGGALWSVVGVLWLQPVPSMGFIVLCMVTVLFSILGDLAESMFKRNAGVKDSGRLLPGHGGVLDRIDSVTAAAPVFAFGLLLLESGL